MQLIDFVGIPHCSLAYTMKDTKCEFVEFQQTDIASLKFKGFQVQTLFYMWVEIIIIMKFELMLCSLTMVSINN